MRSKEDIEQEIRILVRKEANSNVSELDTIRGEIKALLWVLEMEERNL